MPITASISILYLNLFLINMRDTTNPHKIYTKPTCHANLYNIIKKQVYRQKTFFQLSIQTDRAYFKNLYNIKEISPKISH